MFKKRPSFSKCLIGRGFLQMMASEKFKFLSGPQMWTLLWRLTGLRRWRRSPAIKTRRYVNVANEWLPKSNDCVNIMTGDQTHSSHVDFFSQSWSKRGHQLWGGNERNKISSFDLFIFSHSTASSVSSVRSSISSMHNAGRPSVDTKHDVGRSSVSSMQETGRSSVSSMQEAGRATSGQSYQQHQESSGTGFNQGGSVSISSFIV